MLCYVIVHFVWFDNGTFCQPHEPWGVGKNHGIASVQKVSRCYLMDSIV